MRLDGWKQIAEHFGVSIGVARGLCHVGFPVRRTLNGRVWTTTEALWLWGAGVVEVNEQLRKRHIRPPGVALH